jgi:glycosyltransferase involved in cell wall biosynthesis
VGEAEMAVANLAPSLFQQGASPVILTARFDPRWPSDLTHREVPVHRLPFRQRFGWGMTRYMIALSRWLRKNQPDIDLVCVSHLAHEAHAVIGALRESGTPIVLRAENDLPSESALSIKSGATSSRLFRRCQMADAVVAASGVAEQAAVDAGFDRSRIHLIPNGVETAHAPVATRQAAARAALNEVNHDLLVPADMPVVVSVGPMETKRSLRVLIGAWSRVAERWPFARLWVLGDGTLREWLFQQVRESGLLGRVLLPGTFDDIRSVLQAADLLVLPSLATGEPWALLEAMVVGLPVIATDSPGYRDLIMDGESGRVVPSGSPARLADAILATFDDPRKATSMAAVAAQRVRQERSPRQMVARHMELFQELTAAKKRSAS